MRTEQAIRKRLKSLETELDRWDISIKKPGLKTYREACIIAQDSVIYEMHLLKWVLGEHE